MADSQKKLIDAKKNMYNTEALFSDITNQLNKLVAIRDNNLKTLESTKKFESDGLTIDPDSMSQVLKTETEIYQGLGNTLAKLNQVYSTVAAIRSNLHYLVDTQVESSKPKSFEVRRKIVTIKST